MKKPSPLRDLFNATGIPDAWGNFRAYTQDVRREQENFQRQLQWLADTQGLKALEDKEKRESAVRRKAFWGRFGL